jgi:hypothetical protein
MNEAFLKLLQEFSKSYASLDTFSIMVAMLAGTASSIAMYIVYELLYSRKNEGSQINRSFMLMGPAVTALFIAIQFSLPLSLGLLGALSFVRYRTPVKDAEESSYVLVIVALSVCAATFNYLIGFVLILLVIAGVLARRLLLDPRLGGVMTGQLLVVGSGIDGRAVSDTLDKTLDRAKLVGIAEQDGVSRLHFSFNARNLDNLPAVAQEIERMQGVARVDVMTTASE